MKRTGRRMGVALALVAVAAVGSAVVLRSARAEGPSGPPMQKKIEQAFLLACVGDWTVEFTTHDPSGKTQTGKATSHTVLGVAGTVLVEDYAAPDMGGMSFAGHGLTKVGDDGKTVTCWWIDNMSAEPMKLTGTVTDTTLDMTGAIPGMGDMHVVSKKVDGGFDWDATVGGAPMLTQKYRKAK